MGHQTPRSRGQSQHQHQLTSPFLSPKTITVLVVALQFNPERFPDPDDAIRSVPRRVTWRNIRKVLQTTGFQDVIDFLDNKRTTANLFATDDSPHRVSMERSVTFRVEFNRVSYRTILSSVFYVMPNRKRSSPVSFDSPRSAILAALEGKKYILDKRAYTPRGRGNIITPMDEE